jgi:hypothetical protein
MAWLRSSTRKLGGGQGRAGLAAAGVERWRCPDPQATTVNASSNGIGDVQRMPLRCPGLGSGSRPKLDHDVPRTAKRAAFAPRGYARGALVMDLAAIERRVRPAGAVVVDPRVIRRVIKAHRRIPGLAQVPHGRCYGLIARPSPRELVGRGESELLTRLWRAAFHARVHLALEQRRRDGVLEDSDVRRRIDHIGQTEFDEIRAILRHDDKLFPPFGDFEVYCEFAALYLELRHFAPSLLVTTFPGLSPHAGVDEALANDLEVDELLERGRPDGVETSSGAPSSGSAVSFSAPASFAIAERLRSRPVSARKHASLMKRADAASKRGNHVRAALLRTRASHCEQRELRKDAEESARGELRRLGQRLAQALRPPGGSEAAEKADWSSLFAILGDEAAATRALHYSVEARLLYLLQRAAVAAESELRTVDVATWLLSGAKRPVVRPLPATRELRVSRHIHEAAAKVRNTRLPDADRKLLRRLLNWAADRADRNVRLALRPRVHDVLDRVGLRARNSCSAARRRYSRASLADASAAAS